MCLGVCTYVCVSVCSKKVKTIMGSIRKKGGERSFIHGAPYIHYSVCTVHLYMHKLMLAVILHNLYMYKAHSTRAELR